MEVRVGLLKEISAAFCKAKFLRVLFKVVGRGVAQELTSSYISQWRIKRNSLLFLTINVILVYQKYLLLGRGTLL